MTKPLKSVQAMKIQYFHDTDTLYIDFKAADVAETKDLDENTLLDIDRDGNICGITVEHASQCTDIPHFSYEQVVAAPDVAPPLPGAVGGAPA
jgi:uncharacterized protein YuzE